MEYILIIILLIVLISFALKINYLENSLKTTNGLLMSITFALYDKRKNEIKDRILEMEEIREAIKIAKGEKLPTKDTPKNDYFEIFGTEIKDKYFQLRQNEVQEIIKERYKK
ncbi:MAG: hypothetical protein Q8O27_00345 [Enterobacteriaceae bacterium]|nr:hypothetical protein [Enterobacteriaceae bacterium]